MWQDESGNHLTATKDREKGTGWADTFRYVAWIFTALGVVLLGDWKKLLARD
jgi:hypothetical protein